MRRSGGQGDQVMDLQPAELHELPIADAGGQPQAQRGLEMPTAEVSLGTIDTPKAVVGACQAIHLSPSVIKT
jgi:hypothetical protein